MAEPHHRATPLSPAALPRREFLRVSQGVALGGALVNLFWVDTARAAIPVSEGYLLVDTKKCQGCLSCMLACSLVHEGEASLSLARIQVLQDSFARWPDDVSIEQCRQCVDPRCVSVCPTGALKADRNHGNVRWVDREKCTGCLMCVKACPHTPSRATLIPDAKKDAGVRVEKCDLCADAPYHWDKRGGGPAGKQACVEVCPVGAIKFTEHVPTQDDAGYKVNLRGPVWRELGYPTD